MKLIQLPFRLLCVAAALLLASINTVSAQQKPSYAYPTDPNARDLIILTKWFEGEFDNEEQLWFENDSRSATPEAERKSRLHTMHRRLDLPAFGEHVFYVEEYKNNDVNELVRQRFVIFSSDTEAKKIRMQQGFFKDTEMAKGAQFAPEKLAKLKPKDVFFMDECDVFWERSADQFVGAMKPKACVFGKDEKRRYSVHNLILSQDKYWRVDSTRLVSDDSLYVGHPEDQPYHMRRAFSFICEVSFRSEDNSVQKLEGIKLHSQGGTANLTRESDGQEFVIRLRDKQYPYYDTRPDFLFFSVRKAEEKRSLFYSIHDSESRRLGINGNGMGFNCHREGYSFRQAINEL